LVAAQNGVTTRFSRNGPEPKEIRDLVAAAWRFPKVALRSTAGERLFFYEQRAGDQPALYVPGAIRRGPRFSSTSTRSPKDGLIAMSISAVPDGGISHRGVDPGFVMARGRHSARCEPIKDLGEELDGIKNSPLAWTKANAILLRPDRRTAVRPPIARRLLMTKRVF